MVTIPFQPVVLDGIALESRHKQKGDAEKTYDDDSGPEQSTYPRVREYSYVEEEECEFQKGSFGYIYKFHDVKKHAEVGNVFWG